MDVPDIPLIITREQATILVKLLKITIAEAQLQMKTKPDQREIARKVILECQAVRRQIPECYWR